MPNQTETVTLTLNISSDLLGGMYEGRIIAKLLDGEEYKAIFGFLIGHRIRVHAVDPYGNPIRSAKVTIVSQSSGEVYDVFINESGVAEAILLPDNYTIFYIGNHPDDESPALVLVEDVNITSDSEIYLDMCTAGPIDLGIPDDFHVCRFHFRRGVECRHRNE